MFRVTTHIERLLTIHDCVIIPNFGGFVLQTTSARCQQKENTFLPMRKELAFNPSLLHSDGLLVNSYMQVYEVDFLQAKAMLDSDVEDLQTSLHKLSKVSLGSIGFFRTGETGQTIFSPGETDLFNADFYGLTSFGLQPLPPITTEDREEEPAGIPQDRDDAYYIRVSRRLLHSAIASAAAVVLFLLISTPVKDVNPATYTASFLPIERIAATTVPVQVAAEVTGTTEAFVSATTAIPVAAVKASPAPLPKAKTYYVIIGSFPNEEQANLFIAGVDAKAFANVNTVVRDGKHRVYANAFDNREDAESYLNVVRGYNKYETAWLFISR